MPDRCLGRTKEGRPCSAKALPGSDHCPWHDEAWAERRQQWSKKGGKGRSNEARARKALAGDVRDLADVKARLMTALAKVEAGELEPGPANAMANLARAVVAVAGVADFEAQLAQMREQLADFAGQKEA